MNSRERILLIALVMVLGGGALMLGTYQWFIKPMRDVNKQIAEMREKRDEAQFLLDHFDSERPMLLLARTRSLPGDPAEATFEYMTVYLQRLLNESGLRDVNLTRTQASEQKFTPTIPGVKKAGHQVLTFSVRAKGEVSQLVWLLERMQRTPYEHRVKVLTIDRVDVSATSKDLNPKINVSMTIETLLVAKTQSKQGQPPELLDKSKERKYADIAGRNVFVGAIPYPPPVPPKPKPPPTPKPPTPEIKPSFNVPAYIRLVQTLPNEKTAYLRNLAEREPERKLIAKANSGYDTFRIVDAYTGYVFFKAKVLRIDSRAVYFQVKDEIYEVTMGMNLEEATEFALTADEIEELELSDLYDEEWASQGTGAEKATTKKKTTTTPKKGSK